MKYRVNFRFLTLSLFLGLTLSYCNKRATFPIEDPNASGIYTVGGTVTGLTGSLTLSLNNEDSVSLSADGAFTFSQKLNTGDPYDVIVGTQPSGQTCTVVNGSGTIASANITNVFVSCSASLFSIGGTVSGLEGVLTLQNNASESLIITKNGSFEFLGKVTNGSAYSVTVLAQPSTPKQTCSVSGAAGTVAGSNVTSITVTCTTQTFTVGGSVTGLAGGDTLSIELNNGADSASLTAVTTSYAFPTALNDGSAYIVKVVAPPTGKSCTILNQTGVIAGTNVTNVDITCGTSSTGTINLSFSAAPNATKAIICAYNGASSTQILNPVAEFSVSVGAGSTSASVPVDLPAGTYTLRGFLDNGSGFNTNSPDGLPTIGPDPQGVLTSYTAGTSVPMSLADTNTAGSATFNAYLNNESAQPQAPNNGTGTGLCNGYYLRLESQLNPGVDTLSSLQVRLPTDGSSITLLDDGGCAPTSSSNLSKSNDYQAGDNNLSYGIRLLTAAHAGDYIFYYRNTSKNLIHISVDNIASVIKLNRNAYLTSPLASAPVTTRKPTIAFSPVTGAASYQVSATRMNGSNELNVFISGTSYTPPTNMGDNQAYAISIIAYDTDVNTNADFDARSRTPEQYFLIDQNGADSVIFSGSLVNQRTRETYLLKARGTTESNNYYHGSLLIDKNATSYQIAVLKDSGTCNNGKIEIALDYDKSGEAFTIKNEPTRRTFSSLNACADLTQDITIHSPILLDSPGDSQGGLGNTPAFTWFDYSTYAVEVPSGAWSYLIFAQKSLQGAGMPDIMWGLPKTALLYDMSAPPTGKNRFDIQCLATGGTWDGTTCTGGTSNPVDLSGANNWYWSVAIVECDYDDFLSGAGTSYTACIGAILGASDPDFFARSENRFLKTN